MNLQENNRIPSFDYIRIIALLGILLCHSCFEPAVPYPWLGRFLGVTFNFIFLVLSAFLFGLGWAAKGYIVYHRDFVIKRMAKLSRTYYPYLVFLFLFLYLTQNYFSIQKAATHLIYLPWFDKIEGFGHLWFMTMIMVCYIGCWMLTKVSEKIINCNIFTISVLIGGGRYLLGLFSYNIRLPRIHNPVYNRLYPDIRLFT